jgi:hypothetical protein
MKQILLLIICSLCVRTYGQEIVTQAFICPGDTVRLIAESDSADMYEWYKDGQFLESTVSNSVQVAALGKYAVRAYNFNGCYSDFSNAFVIEEDSIYAAKDTASLHASATVMIPVVNNDKGGCFNLNKQSVQIVADPWHGKAILRGDGMVEYIPDRRSSGIDWFEYTVTDMNQRVSNRAVVTIWIGNECGVVFPNPTNDKVTLRTRNNDARFIRLCDVSGKILQVEPMQAGEKVMSIVSYPDGIYLLQLMDGNGKTLCTFKVDKRQN